MEEEAGRESNQAVPLQCCPVSDCPHFFPLLCPRGRSKMSSIIFHFHHPPAYVYIRNCSAPKSDLFRSSGVYLHCNAFIHSFIHLYAGQGVGESNVHPRNQGERCRNTLQMGHQTISGQNAHTYSIQTQRQVSSCVFGRMRIRRKPKQNHGEHSAVTQALATYWTNTY